MNGSSAIFADCSVIFELFLNVILDVSIIEVGDQQWLSLCPENED